MPSSLLQPFEGIHTPEVLAFLVPFVVAVWIDLRSHKEGQAVTMRDAALWSVIWVLCASAFAAYVFWSRGPTAASLYTTGYILEKALAVDNLFAFFLIFKSFGLITEKNQHLQHRILYWGILGAVVFRVLFLGLGAIIVNLSPFVLLAFAAVVLWTVIKMWRSGESDEEPDYSDHWSVRLVRRFARVNPSIDSHRFYDKGFTPLFLCLVCIEVCDLVFAFDSMPVIIAVVRDPYLMITSSLWAAAGLRSLYFLLIAAQNRFWALDKAVMLLLVFVAVKLSLSAFGKHLPHAWSLAIVATILMGGVCWSLFLRPSDERLPPSDRPPSTP